VGTQGVQGTTGQRGNTGNTGTQGTQGSSGFRAASIPATETSPGTVGDIAYNNNYIYICVATNVWKKFLSTAF